MFDYYDTEAAHLSEMAYEYDNFEPYTDAEKRDYLTAKSNRFRKADVGKWVVTQTPRRDKKLIKRLYLVDRKRTHRFWWSHDADYAMVFEKRTAAEYQARRYKFNNARVMEIKPYMADEEGFEAEYGEDYHYS